MGKTPKVKNRQVSVHSRAARRAASPSDLDKSLAFVKAPATDYNPRVLGAQDAGISKKQKQKRMTRQQRLRHERGIENAERNVDKLETKVAKSHVKGKRVKDRSAAWEELNQKPNGQPQAQQTKDEKDAPARRMDYVDDEQDVVQETAASTQPTAAGTETLEAPKDQQVEEEVDEIL
ncbi:hypothetical protein H2203_001942 [Taxawa tesnikishii (nom. ined.)]|nr:hypothetical protein H2203_001942 [Dothideales sp. JES 119]